MNTRQVREWLGTPLGKFTWWMAIFTGLALLEAAEMFAGQRFEDFTISWQTALRRGFECYYTLGLLGLVVIWLGRRIPLERGRGARWLSLHLLLSVLFALTFCALYAAVLNGQTSVRGKAFVFLDTFKKLVIFYVHVHVFTYWVILLSRQGWVYYLRYRERERRASELEAQLVRARLDALRMQLNPHFLFNTLNTIAALIHDQPDVADRTVTNLGQLLRQSLDQAETHEIPLQEELAFLERYLAIEQARFGNRLTVEVQTAPGTLEALVPGLILQPIVENAVHHGIEPRDVPGRVIVTAVVASDRLTLCVQDNGPGLANSTKIPLREGIGLRNTRLRLEHLYGPAQSLVWTSPPEGGFRVCLTLPYRVPRAAASPYQTVASGTDADVLATVCAPAKT